MEKVTLTDDKGAGWGSPCPSAAAVTPSDTADLAQPARLYVGTTGDLSVILVNDTTAVTFSSVAAGWLPLIVKRVMSTSTTATDIVACFME